MNEAPGLSGVSAKGLSLKFQRGLSPSREAFGSSMPYLHPEFRLVDLYYTVAGLHVTSVTDYIIF